MRESSVRRNCRFYAINESLFGQSHEQLKNLTDEMDIHLNIHFERCFLIVTGLSRQCYMERLGMRRADLVAQMDALEEHLDAMAKSQQFTYELGILNYDYSKRFVLAVSPQGSEDVDIAAIARFVGDFLNAQYALLKPDKAPTTRSITVHSEMITDYKGYQQAFAQLRGTYERAFFLRECDMLTAAIARERMTPYSMLEAERELAKFSDLLYLRDMPGALAVLDALLLDHLKKAQDRQLLVEVLVFLKKRMQDICLVLGVPWTEEIAGCFDAERFLCIEELHDALCALLRRSFSGATIPPLRPDGLAMRAARHIGKHYYEPLDLSVLSDALHVNPTYLSHTFKSEMRVGITKYITRIRIEQAQRLLRESDLRVSQIAGDVGLPDPRYFNTVFKRLVGCTPTEYREQKE